MTAIIGTIMLKIIFTVVFMLGAPDPRLKKQRQDWRKVK